MGKGLSPCLILIANHFGVLGNLYLALIASCLKDGDSEFKLLDNLKDKDTLLNLTCLINDMELDDDKRTLALKHFDPVQVRQSKNYLISTSSLKSISLLNRNNERRKRGAH